ERTAHGAGHDMGKGIEQERAAEKPGDGVQPIHVAVLLLAKRSSSCCVVPVSLIFGKILTTLLWWASASVSVIASVAITTLKPISCAWRAVDSTPELVATPT